jgi:oligopeptide/dipeptide ABC transporter ATP-binding protein
MEGEEKRAPGPLLQVSSLTVEYRIGNRTVTALNDVSLDVRPSEIVAIVGESGSGKSTLGLSIINLLQRPPARIASGRILFRGEDLLALTENEMALRRGTEVSMIFQDPMSSLDPVYTVGQQLREAINVRERRKVPARSGPFSSENPELAYGAKSGLARVVLPQVPRAKRQRSYSEEVVSALSKVHISDPEKVADKYPHELSGGIAQRVMIAQALVERPALLIADEPTSALDVTTQAQVLKLMRELKDELGSSILFITHDLAVAAQIADRVTVMYAAEIVEVAGAREIFRQPLHPYSEGLILSFPTKYKSQGKLEAISGDVPDLKHPPSGCRFHPRCKYAFERCPTESPELLDVGGGHEVACFLREKP